MPEWSGVGRVKRRPIPSADLGIARDDERKHEPHVKDLPSGDRSRGCICFLGLDRSLWLLAWIASYGLYAWTAYSSFSREEPWQWFVPSQNWLGIRRIFW